MITSYINRQDSLKNILMDDFLEIKSMIFKLYEDIEQNIKGIKSNIKNEDDKIDLNNLKSYLEFIVVLISNLSHIVYATVKYANGKLSEDEYVEEYEAFKNDLENNKRIFDNKFN